MRSKLQARTGTRHLQKLAQDTLHQTCRPANVMRRGPNPPDNDTPLEAALPPQAGTPDASQFWLQAARWSLAAASDCQKAISRGTSNVTRWMAFGGQSKAVDISCWFSSVLLNLGGDFEHQLGENVWHDLPIHEIC